MYTDGLNFRQIGRHLKVNHTTVMSWVKEHAEKLPEAPAPEETYTVGMDELYTFIEEKNRIYILTFVDRKTHCILAWKVSTKRSGTELQDMQADSIQGHDYYSDDYQGYKTVPYWPAIHYPMNDKNETYSVEGSNADLRHYLARFRCRSRCFSRCEAALRNAVKLIVFAYNRRQLFKQQFPNYTFHLMNFITP